jgi:hypothetical protein
MSKFSVSILEDPGFQQAVREGRVTITGGKPIGSPPVSAPDDKPARKKRDVKAELVEAGFLAPGTWVLPVVTASESNLRDWKGRSRRTTAARAAVSKLLGRTLRKLAPFAEHYHQGGTLTVRLTRLGGRAVDRGNLSICLKAAEDAVCLFLGADDGDLRWDVTYHQETGGAVGVRLVLEKRA